MIFFAKKRSVNNTVAQREQNITTLIRRSCSELAKTPYKNSQEAHNHVIQQMIGLRRSLNLPDFQFNTNADYENYRTAILHFNVFAVEVYTQLGIDPFQPSHPFNCRLESGIDSIKAALQTIKEEQSSPEKAEKRQNMIQWLEEKFTNNIRVTYGK